MSSLNLRGITRQTLIEHLRSNKGAYIVGVIVAVCGIFYHVRSYSRSDSLAVCDLKISSEQGFLSLNVPLVRIAAKEYPVTNFTVYELNGSTWIAGKRGKVPLRRTVYYNFMGGAGAKHFAGFGYWSGSWHSPSRPGKFIFLFVPIWFVFLSIYGIFFVFYRGWMRFRLRTLFIITAVFAGLFWLLMLRAPA